MMNRQRLGAIVLVISGIAAFVTPFLLHSPPLQGNPGPGPSNDDQGNGGTNPPGGTTPPADTNPPPGGSKKSLQDLLDLLGSCQTEKHGPPRGLMAKVRSLMRDGDSERVDHFLASLERKLDTRSAEKRFGACLNDLRSLVLELRSSEQGAEQGSLQELMDAIESCQTEKHGPPRGLMAKVRSAMRADDSTRTDRVLENLEHRLDSPSAEKHFGACVDDLKSLIEELQSS